MSRSPYLIFPQNPVIDGLVLLEELVLNGPARCVAQKCVGSPWVPQWGTTTNAMVIKDCVKLISVYESHTRLVEDSVAAKWNDSINLQKEISQKENCYNYCRHELGASN